MNRKALVLAIALAMSTGVVYANPPNPNPHGEPNPVPTHCNANNPGHGCPEGAGGHGRDDGHGAVCGNGNHTHNPHCEEAEIVPTVTPPVVIPPVATPGHPTTPVAGPVVPNAPENPGPHVPQISAPQDEQTPSAAEQVVVYQEPMVEIAPAVEPQAMRPVQVLSAGPVLLPATGTPLPYVASLLLGLGLTIGGWLLRRGS